MNKQKVGEEKEQLQFSEIVTKLDKKLDLDCLGGQAEARDRLKELVEQIKYSSVFTYWDSKPPKGTLLVGPPGTGKTHAVRCLANEIGCYLVEIRYEDIASMWVDQPIEHLKRIKEVIDKHSKLGEKVIVFLDEAEVFMPTRDTFGLMMPDKKKTNFFLMWLDGGLKVNPNVYFIAATNHEEGIDPAARREGRFESRIAFDELDIDGVKEVMQIHMALSESRTARKLFGDIEWDTLDDDLTSLTGAEAEGIVKRAKRLKAKEHKANLAPKFEKLVDDSMDDKTIDVSLDMLIDLEGDLVPDPVGTEVLRAAVKEYIADKKKKDATGETVVKGFGA